MTTPTEPSVEASEAVGALAAVIATPSEGGSVYVAHAQIREALSAHILAAGWTSPTDHERAVRQARAEGAAEVLADCARDAANHYVGTGESPTGYAIWRWCTEYAAALRLTPDLPTSAEETA